MSLKTKFKTDADAARDGVWVEYTSLPNADGSVPAFKLARMGKQNRKYTLAIRDVAKNYQDENGRPDLSTADEAKAEAALLDVFVTTVLLDWRNFQPNDDGVALAFSQEAAREIFGSESWVDLYGDLTTKADRAANFRQQILVAQAKNL